MTSAVEFQDVFFSYGRGAVLRGVTARLRPGSLHALFGPNGSGKSTLLKCLAGLLKIEGGRIFVEGKDLGSLSVKDVSRLISYVPQEHKLTFPFTVEEVVLMGRTPHLGGVSGPSPSDVEFSQRAISIIGIEELAGRPYTELSGGQRQLVLVARALAQDTPVMVLDEPTSSLDFKNQMKVWGVLQELKSYGKTIVACTHDPNHVLWFCDNSLILKDGQIVGHGDAKEVIGGQMIRDLYGDVCEIKNGMICPVL